ncbi:phosphoribosylformylglycinamidine synthase subunit PurL [Archaeoglobus profundus]|uniref:Phosphoribosylformylglycinamidine synthase subunit PurL n=1 Tax=Archaeoglobus profundus (strain DSM 5631 / JCM 9629 / NBRC 100127 / Av18) TaxID=572546 RepID=D2RFS1_ARCPA|nr:phosphoribosylformylglycinamidine synthase subunit PurL [Archaeoglobus profundus]ADB57146.1 phosphoribosylformylglycinamidine synthase II [Archaeoglobus profundus DSM 5631]
MYREIYPQVYEINVINAGDEDLMKISDELGLALNLNEMRKIKDYFTKKGRNPTDIELQSIAQAWSEHCCYKSSKCYLREYLFGIEKDYVISAIKEDAGVVEFDNEYAYVVALESHNHPSAIEPYGGASTGIGGILRDVLCMGAQPIALVDPLFFGNLDIKDLPKGVKHPLYLLFGVVAGIRDYGNRVGIPTVGGMVFFDESYVTNCLVNVGCVGIVRKDRIVHSRVGNVGDLFVLVGGATGRDGIHGVTFASKELSEKSEEERGAVQLGNPIMKEPLIHACLEVVEKGLVTGMKDLGGGGLSCVISEMSYAANCGAEVYLDKVHLKEEGMAPWEIYISESQERMMLTVNPKHVDEVLDVFKKWDVPAVVVGKAIPDKVVRVYWKGYKIYELDLDFLLGAVEYCRPYVVKRIERIDETSKPSDLKGVLLKMLEHPNVACREWVIRQYDHEVRACTVLKPLQGRINRETHGDCAVIKPTDSWRGLALTTDVNPWMTKMDPFWGTASSFDEMVRNLVAVNSIPHSFADCLNFGNPEKPERMGEFVQSVRALGWMARGFGLPCVSGNVSFYNETPYSAVAPTPTLMGIGIVEDIRKVVSSNFKGKGEIVLVGETLKEFGGSLYCAVTGQRSTVVPKTSPKRLKRYVNAMLQAFKEFKVYACHDLAEGGLAVALAEMCIGGFGCKVDLSELRGEDYVKLFSESNTRWLVEVDNAEDFVKFMKSKGLSVYAIGVVEGDEIVVKNCFRVSVEEVEKVWRNGLVRFTGW